MANVIWGLSLLGPRVTQIQISDEHNMDVVINDIINRLLRDMSKLRTADITILVEALARLQYKNIDFAMKVITYETKLKIKKFHDLDIPRYLWSLANLGYPSRDGTDKDGLLSAFAWESKERLLNWNGLEMARVVWAFGVLQFKSIQQLLATISLQYVDRLFIKGDAAVKFIWGFDALNHHPGKLALVKLGRSFAMDLQNLLPRDIATGFMSLLSFRLVDDRVPTRMKELILRSEVERWTPREAANLIWGLARADFLEQDTFMILRRFILQCQPELLNRASQIDLYRCYLHLHVFRPSLARLLPSSIMGKCQRAWIEEQSQAAYSPILFEVLEILVAEGYATETNCAIQDGLLFAHTAAKDADQQFAVEIIHPPKCFINDPNAISEKQKWREDLLTAWGWKILRVDEKRWMRFESNEDKISSLKTIISRA